MKPCWYPLGSGFFSKVMEGVAEVCATSLTRATCMQIWERRTDGKVTVVAHREGQNKPMI